MQSDAHFHGVYFDWTWSLSTPSTEEALIIWNMGDIWEGGLFDCF